MSTSQIRCAARASAEPREWEFHSIKCDLGGIGKNGEAYSSDYFLTDGQALFRSCFGCARAANKVIGTQ